MDDPRDELIREFERLGLDPRRCPIVGSSRGAIPRLLARVRTLPAPQRWRDILPDWPPHWDENDPESWTIPQVRRGAHDYADYPRGPIYAISVPGTWHEADLNAFVKAAVAGTPDVYNAVFVTAAFGPDATRIAEIVFVLGTTEEQLGAFLDWIDTQGNVESAGQLRGVDAPDVEHCAYHLY